MANSALSALLVQVAVTAMRQPLAAMAILLWIVAVPAASLACDRPAAEPIGLLQAPIATSQASRADGFGPRRHPILGIERLHTGVDWLAPVGTPVVAAAAGRIAAVGRNGEFGNRIVIEHAGGMATTYSHLQRFAPDIAAGTCVAAGQPIATVGATGLTTTPHLHFEVYRNGLPIDPDSTGLH